MPLPDYTCPPQSKQLSTCLSPAIHITVLELSGNFVLQTILSWCLVSFTQHFVSMLFHVSLSCSILLNSILLYECTTFYLSIFLLMAIWVISNLGLLWKNVLVHFFLFFIGIEYDVCFPHYWYTNCSKNIFLFCSSHLSLQWIYPNTDCSNFSFSTSVPLPILYYLASEEKKYHR